MEEPITVTTTAEAITNILSWLGGFLGLIGMFCVLKGFLNYYVSSGNEEKKREAMNTTISSLGWFFSSIALCGIAFFYE